MVNRPILLGPEDVFTLLSCCLGPGDENDGFFTVVTIFDVVLHIRGFDVEVGIETVQFWDSDLSKAGCAPESGCEACEEGRILWVILVQCLTEGGEVPDGPGGFLFAFGGSW